MKILIVVSSLSGGGAERAASLVSQSLAQWYDTAVCMFHDRITYPYGGSLINARLPYDPDPSFPVKMRRLWVKSALFRQAFRRVRPDLVLSFSEGPNLIMLLNRTGRHARYIANIQVPPSRIHHGTRRYIYRAMVRALYPRADGLIALSEGVRDELVQQYGMAPGSVRVISNPIDCEDIRTLCQEPVEEPIFHDGVPVILNVGRLAPQKNQTLLLRAFRRVRQDLPLRLAILGTGPLDAHLRGLAHELGIAPDVHFLGWQSNPFKYMARAAAFVLSSDFEGMGNVIVEAMACGCPVIATDCTFGPSEILQAGRYGILTRVGDEEGLARAIDELMRDAPMRRQLAETGRERARRFDIGKIGQQYHELFEDVVHGNRPFTEVRRVAEPLMTYGRESVEVVYVTGTARSGSTVLDVVLGNHPRIVAVGELAHYSREGWLETQYCACGRRCTECAFWSEVRQEWIRQAGPAAVDRYRQRQEAFERVRRWMRLVAERRRPSADFEDYARTTEALFRAIRTVSGRAIIVDSSKKPGRAFALTLMSGLDVKLIHLVRDGRGVAFSLAKSFQRNERVGIQEDFIPHPVWHTIFLWVLLNEYAGWVRGKVGAQRSMILRYEDFVGDPRQAFRHIGDLLHLDMDGIADALSHGEIMKIGHTVAGGRVRMSGSLQTQLDAEWMSRLNARDERVIRAMAGWLLRRYGYVA